MLDGATARDRLERLFHVLPAAMRQGGAHLAELSRTLGAPRDVILKDIEEMTDRAFYQPGGWPDDVQILIDRGRVRVQHAKGFERPVRLTREEVLCLALALRGTAASARVPDTERRQSLLHRAESHLGGSASEEQEDQPHIAAPDREPDPDRIRELVIDAARERHPVRLMYLRPGPPEPTVRVVHPYAIVYGEGAWYVVGYCDLRNDVRVFRMDRILFADRTDTEGRFAPPDDFQVREYVGAGYVYHAEREVDVGIRYSARIAPWVREHVGVDGAVSEPAEDGTLLLWRRVSDPWWVVSHVLQYGGDAELVAPGDVRALVQEVAEGLLSS